MHQSPNIVSGLGYAAAAHDLYTVPLKELSCVRPGKFQKHNLCDIQSKSSKVIMERIIGTAGWSTTAI